jgi:hypothetical protein
MGEAYSSVSLTRFASTIAAVMDIDGPAAADDPIGGFNRIITDRIDRAIIYNPDAIGMWL